VKGVEVSRARGSHELASRQIELYLVDIAPAPTLTRLKRSHNGVLRLMKVLGGVFVLR
jgi:hypothetical protein